MNADPQALSRPIQPFGDAPIPEPGPRESWRLLPKHGPCFVCQSDNPGGLQADLYLDGDVIRVPFAYRKAQEGPPGHAHGGSIAALLDEVMGAAAWNRRQNVLAAHIEFDFRRPIPLGADVMALGWVKADGSRSVRVACEIRLPDGTVAAQGSGVFAVAPTMFSEPFFG